MLCFNGVFPLLMVFGSSERCLRRFLAESLSVIEMAAVGAKRPFVRKQVPVIDSITLESGSGKGV